MKIAENIIIETNSFSKNLFKSLILLCLLAFFISLKGKNSVRWISLGGLVFFSAGYWAIIKTKISVDQKGFSILGFTQPKSVLWKEITSVSYETVYAGHHVTFNLIIIYENKRMVVPINQYNKIQMQRFFEIINEQCTVALKNQHFIKKATGEMFWKDKLKML